MNDLEQAARQALEALEHPGNIWNMHCQKEKAVKALRQALEQPKQPYSDKKIGHVVIKDANVSFAGFELPDGRFDLYIKPPKRKPLTDEQIEDISKDIERSDFFDCVVPFARAIEQAHGIKENT